MVQQFKFKANRPRQRANTNIKPYWQVIDDINISGAIRFGNRLCVENLTKKPDFVVIDGNDKQILEDIEFQTIIKGDMRVRSIAAASILAKVTRDRIMKKYAEKYKNYGFDKHMGYGTAKHISNIEKYGYTEIHRKSFKLAPRNLKLAFDQTPSA